MDLTYLYGIPVFLIYVTTVWIISLVKRDAGIMDIFWGPGFILLALTYGTANNWNTWRDWLILGLTAAWGLRLATHIAVRNSGQPEDPRYLTWRKENGNLWWWRSYFKVFLLQGVVMWIVSIPLFTGRNELIPTVGFYTDIAGISLFLFGLLYESIADYQLLVFKRKPDNRGKIFTGGLWRYSRHPNYFGEALVWWGFGIIAAGTGAWYSLVGPLLMTFLLLKVSGVSMLDKLMRESRPGYDDYIKSTNAFIPGLKRS